MGWDGDCVYVIVVVVCSAVESFVVQMFVAGEKDAGVCWACWACWVGGTREEQDEASNRPPASVTDALFPRFACKSVDGCMASRWQSTGKTKKSISSADGARW
ncbi:hypothetical protein PMIN06_011741 [Paraphaeosphaeria minitans]